MNLEEVLLRPIVTEKSTRLTEAGWYTFEVRREANKIEIRKAVEKVFKVDVVKVNTMNISGKIRRRGQSQGRTRSWKKAMVALASGQRIELFGGV
ncbi:MAG: 50S ribosomal protein L23 [Chloroflexi bacterium]|nr:50S ribosomal protein L23 [Chloroflexota bacterium]